MDELRVLLRESQKSLVATDIHLQKVSDDAKKWEEELGKVKQRIQDNEISVCEEKTELEALKKDLANTIEEEEKMRKLYTDTLSSLRNKTLELDRVQDDKHDLANKCEASEDARLEIENELCKNRRELEEMEQKYEEKSASLS